MGSPLSTRARAHSRAEPIGETVGRTRTVIHLEVALTDGLRVGFLVSAQEMAEAERNAQDHDEDPHDDHDREEEQAGAEHGRRVSAAIRSWNRSPA